MHATESQPATEAVRKSLQATLDDLHQKDAFPGATAAVVLKDGTLVTVATGKSDRESGTTMHPNHRMLAGTIGKTFFAAIVMNMVHDKRLSLDEKIQTYIGSEPWFHRLPNAGQVTIRMLMNRLACMTPSLPSAARPGLICGYSMANSPFKFEGRTRQDGKLVINPQVEWAGGGFVSTSTDLTRWARNIYEGRASPPNLPAVETGVPANTGPGDKYGLGAQIRQTDFGETYGHGGWSRSVMNV